MCHAKEGRESSSIMSFMFYVTELKGIFLNYVGHIHGVR